MNYYAVIAPSRINEHFDFVTREINASRLTETNNRISATVALEVVASNIRSRNIRVNQNYNLPSQVVDGVKVNLSVIKHLENRLYD